MILCTYLEISVDEVVDLEIFVIVSPWIEQGFGNLDPTKIGDKFNQSEDWNMDNRRVEVIWATVADADTNVGEQFGIKALPRLQVLVAKQVGHEVRVNCHGDDL